MVSFSRKGGSLGMHKTEATSLVLHDTQASQALEPFYNLHIMNMMEGITIAHFVPAVPFWQGVGAWGC